MTIVAVIWWVVALALGHLLVYAAFRPYTDSLRFRIVLGILSFGVLFAIMMPILKNQGPGHVPLYAAMAAVSIAAFTTLYHCIDRWLVAGHR